MDFVPSAVSDPRWALHMCDKKCRETGFKFYELAAIVVEEGDTPHTINLRRKCYEKARLEQGETQVNGAQWKELIKQKTSRGKLWAAFGVDFSFEKCGNVSQSRERGPERRWMQQGQSRTDGSWQQESPCKEELELLRNVKDLRFDGASMRKAGKACDWEEF